MKAPQSFFVCGKPQPAGSKSAFVFKRKGTSGTERKHYGSSVTDANPKSRDWKTEVSKEARRSFEGEPWTCPIRLTLRFIVTRPKNHFRTGKNAHLLRDDAPAFPTVKPDALKLARAVEDALTSICYVDDAMIVTEGITKRYGARQGVEITITEEAV